METVINFLQQGPAETTDYMVAGYAVIFGVIFIYLVSVYIRRRNLHEDLRVLGELSGDLDANEDEIETRPVREVK